MADVFIDEIRINVDGMTAEEARSLGYAVRRSLQTMLRDNVTAQDMGIVTLSVQQNPSRSQAQLAEDCARAIVRLLEG